MTNAKPTKLDQAEAQLRKLAGSAFQGRNRTVTVIDLVDAAQNYLHESTARLSKLRTVNNLLNSIRVSQKETIVELTASQELLERSAKDQEERADALEAKYIAASKVVEQLHNDLNEIDEAADDDMMAFQDSLRLNELAVNASGQQLRDFMANVKAVQLELASCCPPMLVGQMHAIFAAHGFNSSSNVVEVASAYQAMQLETPEELKARINLHRGGAV